MTTRGTARWLSMLGALGVAVATIFGAARCVQGNKCNAKSCPTGCCTPSDTCVAGDVDTQCGSSGAFCLDCGLSNQVCEVNACIDQRADGGRNFAPCDESDYVDNDGGVILSIGGQSEGDELNYYQPACLRVHVGDTVQIVSQSAAYSFTFHPFQASSRGNQPNPIPYVTSGLDASVQFTQPGYYPYWCLQHGDDTGDGMSGVVEVVP